MPEIIKNNKGKYKDLIECDKCSLIFSKRFMQKHFEQSICCSKSTMSELLIDALTHNFSGFVKEKIYNVFNIQLIDKSLVNVTNNQRDNYIFLHQEIFDNLSLQDEKPIKLTIMPLNSYEIDKIRYMFFIPMVSSKLNPTTIGFANQFIYDFLKNALSEGSEKKLSHILLIDPLLVLSSLASRVNLSILIPSSPIAYIFLAINQKDFYTYFLNNRTNLPLTVGTVVPLQYKEINLLLYVEEFEIKNDNQNSREVNSLTKNLSKCKIQKSHNFSHYNKPLIDFKDLTSSEENLENLTNSDNEGIIVKSNPISSNLFSNLFQDDLSWMVDIAKLDASTEIELLQNEPISQRVSPEPTGTIPGLEDVMFKLRCFVKDQLLNQKIYSQLNFHLPKGVLLYGPSGVGKTMSVNFMVQEMGFAVRYHSFNLKRPGPLDKSKDDSIENKLRDFFETALKDAKTGPTLVFIDEIDAFFPNRSNGMTTQAEKALLASFLTFLDEMGKNIIIVAATNNVDAIDLSLRRAGRLEYEIEFSIPTPDTRLRILEQLLSLNPNANFVGDCPSERVPYKLTLDDVVLLSESTHGFTGADLVGLVNMAGIQCLERIMISQEKGQWFDLQITNDDFTQALKNIKPSAMREISLDIPKVKWDEIGGVSHYKEELLRLIGPIRDPKRYRILGIKPERGAILHGPPGCSKTMIAQALATEGRLNFFSIKGPEIFSKYVGDSEKMIRELFRKAKRASPSIIFFDEIDAIASERGSYNSSGVGDRVLAQLLTEMDGVESMDSVFVLAATNRIDKMDKALLRPGRFGKIIHVPLPDIDARNEILKLFFCKMDIPEEVLSHEPLAEATEDFSGAEVVALCNTAMLYAIEDCIALDAQHFDRAFLSMRPQISKCIDWNFRFHHIRLCEDEEIPYNIKRYWR